MIIRRLVAGSVSGLLLSAGGLLAATSASAASAPPIPVATYPPVSQSVGFSSTDVRVGETITVTAYGFEPLSAATVTTSAGGVLGTGRAPGSVALAGQPFNVYPATADSSGVVTATVRFDEPGVHTVTISGLDAAGQPRSVTSTLDVGPATAPVTGTTTPHAVPGAPDEESSNLLEYGALGVGALVLVGLGFVVVRRRAAGKAATPVRRTPPMPPTGPAHPVPAPAQATVSTYSDAVAAAPPVPAPAPVAAPVGYSGSERG